MNLYTFILEFDEGTYIEQIEAEDLMRAIEGWIDYLKNQTNDIPSLDHQTILDFESQMKSQEEVPVSLDGLRNVWCLNMESEEGLALINVVQTAN